MASLQCPGSGGLLGKWLSCFDTLRMNYYQEVMVLVNGFFEAHITENSKHRGSLVAIWLCVLNRIKCFYCPRQLIFFFIANC